MWKEVEAAIGPKAAARIEQYDRAQSGRLPKSPHHYLVAIGVLPQYRGHGYGGALLRAAIRLAESDLGSSGIALDTGSDANQALYEKFGFSVYATAELGPHRARFMFRPRERNVADSAS